MEESSVKDTRRAVALVHVGVEDDDLLYQPFGL